MNVPTTRLPTVGVSTPSPASTTIPEISWPSTAGVGKATSAFMTWRSVWQTPQAATRTSTSPRRGRGSGSSSIWSGCPGAGSTAARMVSLIACPETARPGRNASTA